MKKAFFLLVFVLTYSLYSQVGIETTSLHADAILDFPTGQNKGIILPMVESLPTGSGATNGTFLIDRTDGRVKVKQNGVWLNLTRTANLTSATYDFNSSADTSSLVRVSTTSLYSLSSSII